MDEQKSQAESIPGKVRVVATGFDFPEGPAVDDDGAVLLVNVRTDVVNRVTPDGLVSVYGRVPGRGNGACLDRDGTLLICDVAARAVVRMDRSGRTVVVADAWQGRAFNGPNDCCIGAGGRVFFTDPDGSSLERRIGAVFACVPGGTARRLARGLAYPNGLALTPDGGGLIVAETLTNRLLLLDPEGGEDQALEVWAELPGEPGPDGMRFGPGGRLHVAHYGAGTVDVFPAAGAQAARAPAARIVLPGRNPTNLCFSRDGRTMYVTEAETSSLLAVEMPSAGADD